MASRPNMPNILEARNQQIETIVQMDDTAGGVSLEVAKMAAGPSAEAPSSSGELAAEQTGADGSESVDPGCVTGDSDNDSASCPALLLRMLAIFSCCSYGTKSVIVPSVARNLTAEIQEFIRGLWRYFKNILGRELQEHEENEYRQLFSDWNTFLQQVQGAQDTPAIIFSVINADINEFISWQEEQRGEQLTEDDKEWSKTWLQRWNMFLQARAGTNITAGETLVTRSNLFLTIVGFIFYTVDLVSDIFTSMYYAGNRQWWQAMGTLTIVYGAVIIHTVVKWTKGHIHCTCAADWLRYIGSLLVNWPDVKQYGAVCRLEWKLHRSPAGSAHLVPEWHDRRVNVAFLKYSEGVCEACPQAILQLCLLAPDLNGVWTWTDYLRIAGACVSLCTAGAALVNLEKYRRIISCTDLPLSELVVLHVWAVPVTVSRLLSVTVLLSVHLYWALAGVALHLALCGAYWCRTVRVPRTLTDVIAMCLTTLQFCMSPFDVAGSVTARRVSHTVHFLVNTAMMVVWALDTPVKSVHPALYTAIICFNAGMFAVGLVGWQLHESRTRI